MSAENFLFDTSLVGVDVAAILSALGTSDGDDDAAVAALQAVALAVASRRASEPSEITIARTFQAFGGTRPIKLDCPSEHLLLTLALVDTDITLGSSRTTLFNGIMFAGTACFAAGDDHLVLQSRQPCDLLHMAIPTRFLRLQEGHRHDFDGFVLRDKLIGRIGWLLCEAPSAWLGEFADFISRLAVVRILQLASQQPQSRLPAWRLKKVQSFVEANISDPLRLEDLAGASGLSRMYFAAQFRAATGVRPHDYILMRRIEHAKRLIQAGHTSLVQVALDCGFQSQAHFCTIFKRVTGLTPSAWRRSRCGASNMSPDGAAPAQFEGRSRANALLLRCSARVPARLRQAAHPA